MYGFILRDCIVMIWTNKKPEYWEYYWAKFKDEDNWLDGSPEIVKVYFDGKISVFRPGDNKRYKLEDFTEWSVDYIK